MSNQFPTVSQQFVYKSRYARYLHEEGRREEWFESVGRYFDFFQDYLKKEHGFDMEKVRPELENAVLDQHVMPSMRALMTAGPALARDHVAGYNCAYHPFDNPRSLDEELFILMCGTGDGFSVETQYVEKLPVIPDELHNSATTIVVEDSKLGWAKAYRELISLLYAGHIPYWDLSKLRPAGARLKVFGGRSSGPTPLNNLFKFTVEMFKKAKGRQLTTLEVHDLGCMVADIVVVGGVRRSALISLSDLHDSMMRNAKNGSWWESTGYRRLANNSAVYEKKPDIGVFMAEWLSLYESKSGERGIFNRQSARKIIDYSNDFRLHHFGPDIRLRDPNWDFGCNPCSEILLRPYEFCNLTEVPIRATDTLAQIIQKIRWATILGTFQSCLTKFRYINKKWQRNCEDERLLGVSLTGIYDHPLLNGSQGNEALVEALRKMRIAAIETNALWAHYLGIPTSAAITCVKPSGTVSELNGTASGIHPRHSKYYIRYMRNDIKDPLTQLMKDQGVQWEVDAYDPNNMVAFKFPMKAPEGAIVRSEITAIQHLELWKLYQIHWCEHKPSITVSVKEHEWMEVGAWVYENFDWVSGISFLPYSEHVYTQAPFTECSEAEYQALFEKTPASISWNELANYESEDMTTGMQEYACVAGGCTI